MCFFTTLDVGCYSSTRGSPFADRCSWSKPTRFGYNARALSMRARRPVFYFVQEYETLKPHDIRHLTRIRYCGGYVTQILVPAVHDLPTEGGVSYSSTCRRTVPRFQSLGFLYSSSGILPACVKSHRNLLAFSSSESYLQRGAFKPPRGLSQNFRGFG